MNGKDVAALRIGARRRAIPNLLEESAENGVLNSEFCILTSDVFAVEKRELNG